MIGYNISFRKLRDTKEDYEKLYNWCKTSPCMNGLNKEYYLMMK